MVFTLILLVISNFNIWFDVFLKYHIKIKIQYYVCSILHLLNFEFSFFFILLRQVFFLSKDNGLFSPLPPLTIDFSIELINFLIIHKCDLSFRLLLPSEIQSQAYGLGGRGDIYQSIFGKPPLTIRPLGTIDRWWMVVRFAFSFRKASSWTAVTLPPAKWWKY